jgi:hypothetical protein
MERNSGESCAEYKVSWVQFGKKIAMYMAAFGNDIKGMVDGFEKSEHLQRLSDQTPGGEAGDIGKHVLKSVIYGDWSR